jgi:hypothetical protein
LTPQEIQRIRQSVRGRMKLIGVAAGFFLGPLIRREKTLWEHLTKGTL